MLLSPIVLSISTLILPLATPPADCQHGRFGDEAQDARAIAAFEMAVDDYVALHRRLERAWPPRRLFTPEVADVFRFRIAEALHNGRLDPMTMVWPPPWSEYDEGWRPMVNEPVPWGVSASRWPALTMLPTLPPELAYRFIGRDLVLVDVYANLVVDILDLALPTPAFTGFSVEPFFPAVPEEDEFEGCRPE